MAIVYIGLMVLRGRDVHSGEMVEIAARAFGDGPAVEGDWLSAAFVDLQVNGFGGVDFNDPQVSPEDYARAAQAIWATGVARFCPTIITGNRERMLGCLARAAEAAEDRRTGPSLAAIHLEGPYISPEDGPRGAHPRQFVRPPDREEFKRLQDAARGRIRLVTLAPETEGALEFIEWLAGQGIVVSLGHTGAAPERIREAVQAGARFSTHLGNGAHEIIHRHRNYIWEQLAADELRASFIVDGHHLPPSVVKIFVRAKGPARSVLVTDAVAPAGCAPGEYQLGEVPIELTAEGRVQIRGSSRLAGSALRLDAAVVNTVRFAGITLAEALDMAGPQPAEALGLKFPRDYVLFDYRQGALRVRATVREGEIIWP